MSVSVVYCPDCGEGCFARNGVAASVVWAEHFAAEPGSTGPER
jgi:hypothetical protein